MTRSFSRLSVLPLILLLCLCLNCERQAEDAQVKTEAETDLRSDEIPGVVMAALTAAFPEAEIRKCTREKEDDAVVYDFEFTLEGRKHEADITEDGTIYNWEREVAKDVLPEAAMTALDMEYPGHAIKEIMEITAVIDGKDVLEGYEVVIETTDNQDMEVTVAPDGRILEESGVDK